jgi:periplasmic divalent cation tolerance protein
MVLVYTTVSSVEVAQTIARSLVKENLVACVNLIPSLFSIYEWEGEINQEPEVMMLLKTTQAVENRVYQRIQELHPYRCPALFSVLPSQILPQFQGWVEKQCRPEVNPSDFLGDLKLKNS